MSWPLALVAIWLISANLIAMFPSRDHHWRAAYVLIALGIPLVGWVTWTEGPVIGGLVLACAVSVLRWPMIYLWRWMKRQMGRGAAGE